MQTIIIVTKMCRRIFIFALLMPVLALGQEAGKSGLAFLKIGVGGRAAALGESYVALADDPTAMYWNPAGLALYRGTKVAFTHLNWLESIHHNFAAVTFPGFGGTLGLAMTLQTIPDIELRDRPTAEPIGTLDSRDLALALSYGRKWNSDLAVGLSVKYLYEKIYLNSASGFAFDFGANWQTPLLPLRLAASLQNLGTMGALVEEDIKLPGLVRIGGAYVFNRSSGVPLLRLTAESLILFEGGSYASAGAELALVEAITLRAGYQFNREQRGVAAGFGTALGRYAVDYGYAPFGNDLGQTHRFSIAIRL